MSCLESAENKIQRAACHLQEIDRLVNEYLVRQPKTVPREREGDYFVWRIPQNEAFPTVVGLVVGDFAQNLRGALDHIVWELSDPAFRERATFLIVDDPDKFRNWRGRIAGLPPDAQGLVEDFQIYNTADPGRYAWSVGEELWTLHQLAIADRHHRVRIITKSMPALLSGGFAAIPTNLDSDTVHLVINTGKGFRRVVDGMPLDIPADYGLIDETVDQPVSVQLVMNAYDLGDVFARVRAEHLQYMDEEPNLSSIVTFADGPGRGQIVHVWCRLVLQVVRDVVLPAFECFCSRA